MVNTATINGGQMRVEMGGCRGSLPVAGTQYTRYGGNTTAIRVIWNVSRQTWLWWWMVALAFATLDAGDAAGLDA